MTLLYFALSMLLSHRGSDYVKKNKMFLASLYLMMAVLCIIGGVKEW